MRIKRTDKNFTVRKKGERQIHYAGKKKSTGNTAGFSPKEKQDMLRQKELSGVGTGGQAAQIQRTCDSDSGRGKPIPAADAIFRKPENIWEKPSGGSC